MQNFYDTSGARAAIYACFPTEEEDGGIHLSELEEFCRRSQWTSSIYADRATGRARGSRPDLQRLLKDATGKLIDVVVVWKLHCFGHDVRQILENIKILDRCRVRFLCPQQGLDTVKESERGRYFLLTLTAVAELQRSFSVARTQAAYQAYRQAHAAGSTALAHFLADRGRASQSGRNLPVGRPTTHIPHDRARKMRAAGKSWQEISAALQVSSSTIRRALGCMKVVSAPRMHSSLLDHRRRYTLESSGARAAIYTISSTDPQGDSSHLAELEEFCRHWKWTFSTYADSATSQVGVYRPDHRRLMRNAKVKRMDVVMLYKLDHLGSCLRDIVESIETLHQHDVRLLVPQQGLDSDKDTVVGKMLIPILRAVVEMERNDRVARTQAGYQAYRQAYQDGGDAFRRFIAGRGRASKSGRNLPAGHPARVFDRERARQLRVAGKSWAEISDALNIPITTVRRAAAEPGK